MKLAEISPFIRFASPVAVPRRKKNALCADCRLIFIEKGTGKINLSGKAFDFYEGTLLFWQAKTPYSFDFKGEVKALVIDFDLINTGNNTREIIPLIKEKSPALKTESFQLYEFSDAKMLNNPVIFHNAFFVRERILEIIREFHRQTPFGDANASAYLKLCLSKTAHTLLGNRDSETGKKIQLITDYISKNFNSTLTNEELAKLAGYHSYYLNRVFKKSTGYTLHQYILKQRLSAACELLLSTTDTLESIGLKTGFSNTLSFINAFKKVYKLTPTQFRNRMV